MFDASLQDQHSNCSIQSSRSVFTKLPYCDGVQFRLCLIQNLWIRLTQQLTAVVDIDAILIDLQ